MKGMRFAAVLAACVSLAAPEVHAQRSNTDVVLAETLYRQGRQLMEEKKYAEACAKFAESQRLDPATGTMLNLASCNESRGRTATAWLQFNEALLSARRDGREDRVAFARERIAALEPNLSRLSVALAPGADLAGLEVHVDGALIGPAALGVPAPVDPGEHRIEASAPGKKGWSKTVTIGKSADSQEVLIPVLVDDPNARSVVAPAPTSAAPLSPAPSQGPDQVMMERPVPNAVYVSGGVTLLLAIGAGVTSAVYLEQRSNYTELNVDPASSSADREAARDKARNWGVANGALMAGALAGAAITGYLYFTRPEVPRKARVAPWMSRHAGGVSVSGSLF